MSVSIIDANHQLPDIESHFKVYAGPGAGKTRFLVNHIKNVLTNSNRLLSSRKIACITFTNVATENILKRVGDHGGRLEISTIHSYLYKSLIKPYVNFIANEYDLKAELVDGHDDILFSGYQFIKEWKISTGQTYLDDSDVTNAFEKLRWKFDSNGDLAPLPPYPQKSGKYHVKPESYWTYKRMVWKQGLLHHDDVLFFSYQIVKKLPFSLEVIRAQFPYFLVDEFQDISPIQIEILRLIGQKETIVGLVGDEAQSIYEFLGVVPGQLKNFSLPGINEYEIKDNHRSSNEIVSLLNKIRPSLYQEAKRNVNTTSVSMVVGDKISAFQWTETNHSATQIISLSRENLTANSLKKGIGTIVQKDLLAELKAKDSSSERRRSISNSTKAVEYARMGYYKDALKTIGKLFNYNKSILDKKKSLRCLKLLLDKYDQYNGKKVIDLYNLLVTSGYIQVPRLTSGKGKLFYESTEYDHLAATVKNLYEAGNHRTIHKSKGEEFETVLLILDKDEKGQFNELIELAFLLNPDLVNEEEHRIKYVALSRPTNHLVINLPSISEANKSAIEGLGITVTIL
jgi:DNA helicase-2/ATP-dependent DNA helicase PcrA